MKLKLFITIACILLAASWANWTRAQDMSFAGASDATPIVPTTPPTNTPRPAAMPVSTANGVVIIDTGGYRLGISRVWNTDKAGYERPDEDLFLIFEVTLHNDTASEVVFYGADFLLHVPQGDFELRNMKEVRDKYYEGRDYPGFDNGQVVAANSSEPSLLVYDLPAGFDTITLEFNPAGNHSSVTAQLSLMDNGEYVLRPIAAQAVAVVAVTFTPTPIATFTPIPTNTPRPSSTFTPSMTPTVSNTPIPMATIAPTMRPQTRYVTAQTLNTRRCLGTNCDVVMQMSYGDSFEAIGQGEDTDGAIWYSFKYGSQTVWVAGWLTSTQKPTVSQPANPPSSGQQTDSSGGSVSPVAGAAPSCLADFDFSVCAQYQPAPRDCAEVVSRGIPARVAACCFPARDGDKDGLACYGT